MPRMPSNTSTAICMLLIVGASCLTLSAQAEDLAVPVNGEELKPVEVGDLPEASPTARGDDPTVSKPDEVFSGGNNLGGFAVGDDNGVLMDEGHLDALSSTGKRLLTAGRKMLQDLDPKTGFLDLSGSGVSAGDSTAGVSANAYGHGNFDADNLQDNHVEPHGVDASVTAAGTDVDNVDAGVNPDCVGSVEGHSEGSCATVGGTR